MEITDLKLSHLKKVVKIHCQAFPDFNLTLMGRPFIHTYYLTTIVSPNGLGSVALQEGQVIAFVTGTVDSAAFLWRVFLKSPPAFILGIMRICTIKPRMTVELLKKAWRFLRITSNHLLRISPKKQKTVVSPSHMRGYLSSIAISPTKRGSGAASLVTAHFMEHMRARGRKEVYTSTDEGNTSANRFFLKVGFEFVESYRTERNRVSNRYVYRL